MFIGFTVMSLSMLLIGPSWILGLPDNSYIILFGLAMLGSACGLVIIPVLPNMIEAIEEKYPGMD